MTREETAALLSRFTVNPAMRGGKPCIRGMRLTPVDILEYMAGGMSHEEILADFPELEPADLQACLVFAVEAVQARQVAFHRGQIIGNREETAI